MQPTTTRVPAVLSALHERLTTALAGRAVDVVDGPRKAEAYAGDVLLVGMPDGTGAAVDVTVERMPGLGNRLGETFTISCLLSCWAGAAETDFAVLRAGADGHLAAVDEALREDRALGGVCDLVTLGPTATWGQVLTPKGAVLEVAFTVTGRALL